MIVVKIELWPHGDASRIRELGRMYIANRGESRDPRRGDYDVAVCRRGSDAVPQPISDYGPLPTRRGEVRDYPRLSYNVWRLIARALLAAFPEERGTMAKFAESRGIRPEPDVDAEEIPR